MQTLKEQLKKEHEQVYKDLELFLIAISQVKVKANNPYLLEQVSALLNYVRKLLDEHFSLEEKELFPKLESSEALTRIIEDHKDISNKYQNLKEAYDSAQIDLDLTHRILFPAYNLIASINHHAQREDLLLFTN